MKKIEWDIVRNKLEEIKYKQIILSTRNGIRYANKPLIERHSKYGYLTNENNIIFLCMQNNYTNWYNNYRLIFKVIGVKGDDSNDVLIDITDRYKKGKV